MEVEPPLVASELRKVYAGTFGRRRRVPALDGVSFEVARGRVLGLVGPNGSGKTTAIRCSLGLLAPTSGRAAVFGAPAGSLVARTDVGFAPEHLALSGKRSGRETLALLARLAGIPESEVYDRVASALRLVALDDAGHRRIGGYSKGMLRRLSIAAALQHDPKLLVLDEPFDGLDPIGSAAVRDEIARRSESGVAVLVSSHALAELEAVATDLLVLDRGVAIESGPRDDVLSRPGVTSLLVRGLSDQGLTELERLVGASGGEVVERGPARESLEELFRRRVDWDRDP